MSVITRLVQKRGLVSTLSISRLHRRPYSESATQKPRSGHAQWYSDIVPAMIPIFLLGSAIYLGLQLTQLKLSHEKFMEEAKERVRELEAEIDALQEQRLKEKEASPPKATSVTSKKSGWW
ncbi:hypothetical protein Hypma_010378 [Hypsizygus marmoreus]|uniref:Uncharacterized protein n=1 Tax=Hypsizygus marmoreus TaxID=39966 RepID=A0A369JMN1_HYPMA|nr:hypothetical protein Hypma_010378 [Hypsizygus marmoreus]